MSSGHDGVPDNFGFDMDFPSEFVEGVSSRAQDSSSIQICSGTTSTPQSPRPRHAVANPTDHVIGPLRISESWTCSRLGHAGFRSHAHVHATRVHGATRLGWHGIMHRLALLPASFSACTPVPPRAKSQSVQYVLCCSRCGQTLNILLHLNPTATVTVTDAEGSNRINTKAIAGCDIEEAHGEARREDPFQDWLTSIRQKRQKLFKLESSLCRSKWKAVIKDVTDKQNSLLKPKQDERRSGSSIKSSSSEFEHGFSEETASLKERQRAVRKSLHDFLSSWWHPQDGRIGSASSTTSRERDSSRGGSTKRKDTKKIISIFEESLRTSIT